MAGRYVPPHLRNKSENEKPSANVPPPAEPVRKWVTKEEIHNYFWPDVEEESPENKNQHNEPTFPHARLSKDGKTLHDSAKTPGELAYVLLFSDRGKPANPRWETDGIIFTKSSLDLLPGYQERWEKQVDTDPSENDAAADSDAAPNTSHDPSTNKAEPLEHPVAVFKQTSGSQKSAGFVFEGWYKIERTAFLDPHSEELKRMLEQKWSRTDRKGAVVQVDRTSENWMRSLSLCWAVVKFVKDYKAEEELGMPVIEHLPEPEKGVPKKGVNEMLAEMRLKDSGADSVGGSAGDAAGPSVENSASSPDQTSNGTTEPSPPG